MAERPPDALTHLRYEIIKLVKNSIEDFYAQHPRWLDDPRSRANIDSRWEATRQVLRLLDNYDIRFKP